MTALPRPSPGTLSAFGSGTYTATRAARAPVVIIERDARTRGTIVAALGEFRIHEAESLSVAGALVSEVQPRAIVCSMGFDSLELLCFARWLRITFGRSIALIVLTPRGDAQQAIRALQIGARACLDLPVDPARLRVVVAKHATPAGDR